jgi:copper oxidase (laccase) domain-containing protein
MGSVTTDISVWIGPAVQKESYVFDYFDQPGWKHHKHQLANGRYQIDMVGYNIEQLARAGIAPTNIESSDTNTCSSANYFSHCRSTRTGEPEGRFATVVGII